MEVWKMPFIELRNWDGREITAYVTVRSPIFDKMPFGVHSVNIGRWGDEAYVERVLEQYMLFYTYDGSGMFEFNGKEFLCEKNKIIIFQKYDHIKYYPLSNWNAMWIFLEGESCEPFYDICYGEKLSATEVSNPTFVENLIRAMRDHIKYPSISCDLACSSLMFQLWNYIIESQKNILLKENQDIIRHCIEFMRSNLDKKISIEQLSEMCFLSHAQFRRVFKKHTGYSPHEYLTNLRISKAKSLLKETNFDLEKISSITGFSGSPHLITRFKQYENITPYEYRKRSSYIHPTISILSK